MKKANGKAAEQIIFSCSQIFLLIRGLSQSALEQLDRRSLYG